MFRSIYILILCMPFIAHATFTICPMPESDTEGGVYTNEQVGEKITFSDWESNYPKIKRRLTQLNTPNKIYNNFIKIQPSTDSIVEVRFQPVFNGVMKFDPYWVFDFIPDKVNLFHKIKRFKMKCGVNNNPVLFESSLIN